MYKEIYDENIMYQMVKDADNEASRLKPLMDYYSNDLSWPFLLQADKH
jgi:hypothetical protein